MAKNNCRIPTVKKVSSSRFKIRYSVSVSLLVLVFSLGKGFSSEQNMKNFHLANFWQSMKQWEVFAEEGKIREKEKEVDLKNFILKFYDESGHISQIEAKRGKIVQQNNQMEAENEVKINSVGRNMVIMTEQVRYLGSEKKILSTSPVKIKQKDLVITGIGLETSPDFSHVVVSSNTACSISEKKININSEKMEMFQNEEIVEFYGKVKFVKEKTILNAKFIRYNEREKIVDAQGDADLFLETSTGEKIKVNAQKIILFDKNNKFYARDKVNIWQGKNYATCEEAEYDINDEHLILSNGSPCLYWQEEGRKGEYKAKKIVFNLHKKRIFLEDNVNGVVTYKE